MRPRTQKQPQDKKELCRVLDYVKAVKKEKKKKKKKKKGGYYTTRTVLSIEGQK